MSNWNETCSQSPANKAGHDEDCGAIIASWQQRAEAAEAKLVEAQKDTERLIRALRNFMACHEMTLPTPYGHDCQWCGNCAACSVVEARAAIAILDAELAKPVAREWGVKHRDGALYFVRADESRARLDCESGTFELFCRTKGFSTPAGPWEPLEVQG